MNELLHTRTSTNEHGIPGLRVAATRVWHSMLDDDVLGRSAQLAYYFFFALFPGLIAASSVIALVVSSDSNLSNNLLQYLGAVIPPSAFNMVAETLQQTTRASGGSKILLGVLLALWSASAGTSALQDALNAVYDVKEGRSFWKTRLNALLLTLALITLFVIALAVLLGGDAVAKTVSSHLGMGRLIVILSRGLAWPVAFFILAFAFALVYYFAPDVKQREWSWITPGAAIGIVAWIASSLGLRIYLHYFDHYSLTYGSLGAVIVLLTWFYLSGLALLLGAEINDTREAMAAERGDPKAKKKGKKEPAAG
ncbi:MAG TPA: YihY/virulence factor BrkB family protein [Acidobacteriaceae bacterium]